MADCALAARQASVRRDAVTAGKRELDALIEEITVDCYSEDEELSGFLTYLEEALEQPVQVTVMGMPVTLVGVHSADGPLPGLVAHCQRDGDDYPVCLLDVAVPRGTEVGRVLAAYRHWAGVDPWPKVTP
jgi:Calcium binding